MKNIILSALLLLAVTRGQLPDALTAIECFQRDNTYYFCSPNSQVSVVDSTTVYDQKGWCCKSGSLDERCAHGADFSCTLDKERTLKPLWSTYWVGMSEQYCGGVRKLAAI